MRFEQRCGLHLENVGELFDGVDRDGIELPLKRRDIGPIDSRHVRQRFLRQASISSNTTQVRTEDLAQRHASKVASASTLHPRSILYEPDGRVSESTRC